MCITEESSLYNDTFFVCQKETEPGKSVSEMYLGATALVPEIGHMPRPRNEETSHLNISNPIPVKKNNVNGSKMPKMISKVLKYEGCGLESTCHKKEL